MTCEKNCARRPDTNNTEKQMSVRSLFMRLVYRLGNNRSTYPLTGYGRYPDRRDYFKEGWMEKIIYKGTPWIVLCLVVKSKQLSVL
jgi:hypothetical protein